MSLLTAADLAYMDATQVEALPYPVVIERVTLVDNGMGGSYESWAAAGTVMGRIYLRPRLGMNEAIGGAQVISDTRWAGTLPLAADGQPYVYATDRLLYSGRTWEVTSTNNDEMWQTAVRLDLESMNEERRT